MKQDIQVIDASCGAGKTEYIIRYMNEHPEKSYLYISPLLDMFNRLRGEPPYEDRGVREPFSEPTNKNADGSKLRGFKTLVETGQNIMSTHALFMMLDDEAISLLQERDYHLIIDEVLDTVTVISKPDSQDVESEDDIFRELQNKITPGDIVFLQENGCIGIDTDDFNRVVWTGKGGLQSDYRYKDFERLVKTGALSYVQDCFLLWHFPIRALEAFRDITILTYRFQDSIMRAYLDFNEKPYRHNTVVWEDNIPQITEYNSQVGKGYEFAQYINIFDNPKLNAIGKRIRNEIGKKPFPLSASWYNDKINKAKLKVLKDNVSNFYRHYQHADKASVMWTTYKAQKNKVKPLRYLTYDDHGEIVETFVPCNCRATEKYANRYNLAYLVDRHLHPGLKAYFSQKDISINEGEWALSELIQWLFRSRIRNTHAECRDITIYIPSERMRNLLKEWITPDAALSKIA